MSRIAYIPLIDINTIPIEPNPGDEPTSSILPKQDVQPSQEREHKRNNHKKPVIFRLWLQKHCLGMIVFVLAFCFIGQASYIHVKASLAQYLLHNAFVHSSAEHNQKPWPWADTWPVAKLSFPSLDEQQIVLAGDSGNALAFGPGLNAMSVDFGGLGTIVIAGHRDTHFSILQHVNPGEHIVIEDGAGKIYQYEIIDISVKNINEDQILQSEHQRLLLVTCYPFNGDSPDTPLRYVIEAAPVYKA